jgi:nitrate/nitrite transporter NarK
MTSLSGLGKALLASSPSLTGSLMRIPYGKNVGLTGGTEWAAKFLILACAG